MVKVVLFSDLAGGVTEKGELYVLAQKSAAVVGDTHKGSAAVFDLDGNVLRTCVNRVFDELLDYGRGSFNDLTRRNQLGYVLIEHIYYSQCSHLRSISYSLIRKVNSSPQSA